MTTDTKYLLSNVFLLLPFLRVLCVLRGERVRRDKHEWITSLWIFTATARLA